MKFCKDDSPYVVTCDTTYGNSSLQNFRGSGWSPKQHVDGWDTSSKDWAHMVLHLPHTEGGVGVPFNCVTKDTAFYTTTSHFVSWMGVFSQPRQELWLPKDDLRDSSSWSSTPLMLLRDIHSEAHDQPSVCESCRFLLFSFQSFITPILIYKSSLQFSLY